MCDRTSFISIADPLVGFHPELVIVNYTVLHLFRHIVSYKVRKVSYLNKIHCTTALHKQR